MTTQRLCRPINSGAANPSSLRSRGCIARLHRRPVHVYKLTGDKYVPFSQYPAGSDGAAGKISLLFHGKHYDALFESSE